MTTDTTAIIEAARGYLGIRFRHQGRDHNGLDCLGLLVCVAHDCKLKCAGRLVSSWDETNYGHMPDTKRLCIGLSAVMQSAENMQIGDVVLMDVDGSAQHLGLIGDYPNGDYSLIHAYAPARKVIEHRLDGGWERRIIQIWRFI